MFLFWFCIDCIKLPAVVTTISAYSLTPPASRTTSVPFRVNSKLAARTHAKQGARCHRKEQKILNSDVCTDFIFSKSCLTGQMIHLSFLISVCLQALFIQASSIHHFIWSITSLKKIIEQLNWKIVAELIWNRIASNVTKVLSMTLKSRETNNQP